MVSIMECGAPQSQQMQQPPPPPPLQQRYQTGPRSSSVTTTGTAGSGGGGSLDVADETNETNEVFTSPTISPPISPRPTPVTGTMSDQSKKSAVSQRSIELQMSQQKATDTELAKRALKLDLVKTTNRSIDEFTVKSPKSPLASSVSSGRLPHHKTLAAQVDLVEDRKTLRDALYQGIFHRHRRTIFAVGSFLRMLRSRNSQYNTIRSSSEGEDIDEAR